MGISVVICTRNRPDLIGDALSSVLANGHPAFDVVVVDQSDDDRTGEIVRRAMERDSRPRWVHTSTPGLSRARNIGVVSTSGEVVAFTDDDCIVPTDWLASIATVFDAQPDADMLYGQVLIPATLAGRPGFVPTLRITEPRRLNRDGFRISGMGANFAMRRRLFDLVGGFDEVLGAGGPLRAGEDFDFEFRTLVAGATTLLRPDVVVEHYGLRSLEQWPETLRSYGIGDGAFYSKHVRCGDLFALRLLVARVGRLAIREALLRLGIRPRGSQQSYLSGCFEGIRAGLRYPVDRRRRLYQQAVADPQRSTS